MQHHFTKPQLSRSTCVLLALPCPAGLHCLTLTAHTTCLVWLDVRQLLPAAGLSPKAAHDLENGMNSLGKRSHNQLPHAGQASSAVDDAEDQLNVAEASGQFGAWGGTGPIGGAGWLSLPKAPSHHFNLSTAASASKFRYAGLSKGQRCGEIGKGNRSAPAVINAGSYCQVPEFWSCNHNFRNWV